MSLESEAPWVVVVYVPYVLLFLLVGYTVHVRFRKTTTGAKPANRAETGTPRCAAFPPQAVDLGKVPVNTQVWQDGHLSTAHEHYKNDKVFMANDYVWSLEQCLLKNGRLDAAAAVASTPWVKEARERIENAEEIMAMINSTAGWQLVRESGGVQTWYRPEESGLHTFRVTGEVTVPFNHLVAVWREVDMFSTWFPMAKSSKELAEVSRFHKLTSIQFYGVWPVASREVVVEARGIDAIERGKALISMQSVTSHPLVNIPPPTSGTVRAEISLGGVLIEPSKADKCHLTILLNMDLKMAVPASVVNFFSSKLFHLILFEAQKKGKQVPNDPNYSRIMAARADVYGYIVNSMAAKFGAEALRRLGITFDSSASGPQLLRASSREDWVPDSARDDCAKCERRFSLVRRRHHCRVCAELVCGACSRTRVQLIGAGQKPQRVCVRCHPNGAAGGASASFGG